VSYPIDTVALFRARQRTYYVRVVVVIVATLAQLFVARTLLGAFTSTSGLFVGIGALVFMVGGSYVVHWKTVRCPKCERWLVPLGINGVAPNACSHCRAALQ
jgi:hypothetical protein